MPRPGTGARVARPTGHSARSFSIFELRSPRESLGSVLAWPESSAKASPFPTPRPRTSPRGVQTVAGPVALLAASADNFRMEIRQWDKRYRSGDWAQENSNALPNPLLAETAAKLRPGKVLDLACGSGRNAIWLAERGWQVTAVDGAPTAIETLRRRAAERQVEVATAIADLQKSEYSIGSNCWDFIAMCFYLQTSLFEPVKQGLKPGGVALIIVHIAAPGEERTEHQLLSKELEARFCDWEILYSYEGKPSDPEHKRLCAELVARKPQSSR